MPHRVSHPFQAWRALLRYLSPREAWAAALDVTKARWRVQANARLPGV
ncbi:MAG TPA: hypothetical protein VF043_04750 [Ktedonobacteraceae bacterium]